MFPQLRTRYLTWTAALLLIGLSCTTWWPARLGDFVWDDHKLIQENEQLQTSAGLLKIWSGQAFDFFPITYSCWWLQYQFWQSTPASYRVINGILYICCCLLLWRILTRYNVTMPWFWAVLFAVHPVQVASVAWISETKNLLGLLFSLGVLWIPPERWLDRQTNWRISLFVLCSFLLALLSKPSTVMLPVVIWTISLYRRSESRPWYRLPWQIWIMLGLSLGISLLTISMQSTADDEQPIASTLQRIAGTGQVLVHYAWLICWPFQQQLISSRVNVDVTQWISWLPLLACGMIICCLTYWRKMAFVKQLWLGCILAIVNLFPVLGLFHMRYHQYAWVADHLLQLGWLGLILGMAITSSRMNSPISKKDKFEKRQHAAWMIICSVLIICWASRSWQRAAIYQNEQMLWETAAVENPTSGVVQFHLAQLARDAGNYKQAALLYERAHQLDPQLQIAHVQQGIILARTGDLSNAQQILASHPLSDRNAEAQFILAQHALSAGKQEAAMNYLKRSIELEPKNPGVLYELARLEHRQGQFQAAIKYLLQSLALEQNGLTAFELAECYKETNQPWLAIQSYETTLSLLPDHLVALNNAAWILATTKEPTLNNPVQAVQFAQHAVQLSKQQDANVLDTLATAYWAKGDRELAHATLRLAIRQAIQNQQHKLAIEMQTKQEQWK